jgi:transposase
VLSEKACQQLLQLLHQSPRLWGKNSSVWSLALLAEVSFEQGLTPRQVSDETIRRAVQRLKVKWKRAKHWITSPDPQYALKKVAPTAEAFSRRASRLGAGLSG